MTVGDDYQRQQQRCRELIQEYREIADRFAIASIELVLKRADESMASGDIVRILESYEEMKGCQ